MVEEIIVGRSPYINTIPFQISTFPQQAPKFPKIP
jgi:hypothetical protein